MVSHVKETLKATMGVLLIHDKKIATLFMQETQDGLPWIKNMIITSVGLVLTKLPKALLPIVDKHCKHRDKV